MTTALFVVSGEGYWGEECTEPLTALSDRNVDVDVATPNGARPTVDPQSIDPDEVGDRTAAEVRELHENDDRLRNPKPIAAAEADMYDTVVFPGGHGTVWDVNQDRHARELLRETVSGDDGKALVICHAVGLLAFTREEDGSFLVEDRDVTGFPNEWENSIVDDHDTLPNGQKLPYRVEDEVAAAGGNWDAELDAEESVLVDGDLITARGPESSEAAARELVRALGVEAD